MMELDPAVEGVQRGRSLKIMMGLDPVRRETKGDRPGNHDGTGSSRRETKGDKPGNHDETECSRRDFFFDFAVVSKLSLSRGYESNFS